MGQTVAQCLISPVAGLRSLCEVVTMRVPSGENAAVEALSSDICSTAGSLVSSTFQMPGTTVSDWFRSGTEGLVQ